MDLFSKIKSCFEKPKTSTKETLDQVFQDYLKIKDELQVSDIKLNGSINFKVNYGGSVVPFWLAVDAEINEEIAKTEIQDALTKIAVGLALDLNLVEISQILKK